MNLNWHQQDRETRGITGWFADTIANFVGSWLFIIIHAVWFGSWIVFKFEPFPYGLLTMVVSLEAIFLTTLVMISQNRQADRDRTQAEADYQTNREAKDEIEELQQRLARIEDEKLDKIISILEHK